MSSLTHLTLGQKAKIVYFDVNKKACRRFMEMGLCLNKTIQILGKIPLSESLIILSENGKYILRKKDALGIKVVKVNSVV